jgi:GNAT superfamily N-acetyltransferase
MPRLVTRASNLQRRTQLTFRPLSQKNWPDLESLFGPRGASGGCWCMWWRLKRSEYEETKGDGNRLLFQKVVSSGAPTGVLAYADGKPVAWCAIAPRQNYPALARSRVLMPVDNKPVWSVTCFYVARDWRRVGITPALLKAAVEYARKRGATIVEGYPHDLPSRKGNDATTLPDAFAWTGFASAFRQAGFHEVARRSKSRPVMRLVVGS